MASVAVSVPPSLVAVTVKLVELNSTEGVPEISPLVVDNERPAGSDGEIDHVTTVPPAEVGFIEIAVPFTKV
tara:strand:+ start:1697 stop:1912 length:216 start_codon:yes stop_codon:yes gene_type:complete